MHDIPRSSAPPTVTNYELAKDYACRDCKMRRSCDAANNHTACDAFLAELAELDALTMQFPTAATAQAKEE